jgi:hypothetical protein
MPVIPTRAAIDAALKGGLPPQYDDALPQLNDGTPVIETNDAGELDELPKVAGQPFFPRELVDTNPKSKFGATKPSLGLVPPVAIAHAAMAFEEGAAKYGPFNWRKDPVSAMTYVNAAKRHLDNYLDGEEYTQDSLLSPEELATLAELLFKRGSGDLIPEDGAVGAVHNLGAVIACCAILLDAWTCGTLINDRPAPGGSSALQEALRDIKLSRAGEADPC